MRVSPDIATCDARFAEAALRPGTGDAVPAYEWARRLASLQPERKSLSSGRESTFDEDIKSRYFLRVYLPPDRPRRRGCGDDHRRDA